MYTSRKEVSVLTGFLSIKSGERSNRVIETDGPIRDVGSWATMPFDVADSWAAPNEIEWPDDTSGHTPDYHIYNITRVSHFHINTYRYYYVYIKKKKKLNYIFFRFFGPSPCGNCPSPFLMWRVIIRVRQQRQ